MRNASPRATCGVAHLFSQISRTAGAIHSVSHDLDGRVEESHGSAASLHHDSARILGAIEEISGAIREVATGTDGAREAAASTRDESGRGRAAVTASHASIEELLVAMGRASDATGEMRVHVHEVVHVLDMIREVAEQTNLLALNAAIEAARTQESTGEIARIAAGLPSGAERAGNAMASFAQSIEGSARESGRQGEA